MLLRCCNLISSFGLFSPPFFFLPPLYFVSLFSFRLNVNSWSGGECSQPAIPHNSLRIPAPSSQISTLFSLPSLPPRPPEGLAGRKSGSCDE